MDFYLDAVTHLTAGTKTHTTGFPVKELEIIVSQKTGQSNVVIDRLSLGVSDGTYQICDTLYNDNTATGSGDQKYLDRIVNVKERVSGTVSNVLIAVVDQSIAPWTPTTVSYIVTVPNGNYQLTVKARG